MPIKDTAGHIPAVSILMPAYNVSRYVRQAIDSVLAQTRPDFELLVVDDGSTDDTAEIVAGYAGREPRIRLIRQPNQGIGAARNTALAAARAPWVALLDSDDVWLPGYLEAQLAILERRPEIDVLSANAVNMGGVWDGLVYNPRIRGDDPIELTLPDLVEHEDAVCILSMIRRHMLEALGGFNAQLRGSEDYDLWLRGLVHGYRIFFNPVPLGGYRRRPDSVSRDELRMLDAIVVPLRLVRAHQGTDAAVCRAIDDKLARYATRREIVLARQALAQGETASFVERLQTLHRQTGQVRYRVGAALCRLSPRVFGWLFSCRSVLRRLRMAAGTGHEHVRYEGPEMAQMSVTITRRRLDRVP